MVAALFDRDVVRATGSEVASYLQGQLSQDIDALAPGSSAWSLVLDPSGKLTSVFRLHRVADEEFLFDAEVGEGEVIVARLERFRLRTDVTFTSEAGWRMLALRGADAPTSVAEQLGGLVARVEWPGFEGVDVLGVDLEAPPSVELDPSAFEVARIRAGVARMGVDLDDETIPAEGGAALLEAAVSFTKGCYTGQELVARIDSRGGNVPRPLRRLRADEPIVAGASVEFDGAEVGTVTSAAGGDGLARIMRKVATGESVTVAGVPATVLEAGAI